MKAYWINASARTITMVDYHGLAGLKALVGGYIELARLWNNGDTLYVDEEGMLKQPQHWFAIDGVPQLLAGNGVLVGRELDDDVSTADPTMSLDELRGQVRFARSMPPPA